MKVLFFKDGHSPSFLFLLLLFSISCSSPSEDSRVVHFDDLEKNSFEDFFFAEDLRLTPLETNSTALIGDLAMIKTEKNDFFLFSQQDGRVHRFGVNGEFLNSIGEIGDAPGEYRQPLGFSIANNLVLILCASGDNSEINQFSLEGEYLGTKTLEDNPYTSFEVVEEHYYFSTGSNSFFEDHRKIHVRDSNEKLVERFLESSNLNMYSITENNLHKQKDGLFYTESFSNNIYSLKKDSISIAYSLDFGDYNFDENLAQGADLVQNFYKIVDKGVGLVKSYYESENLAYINLVIQKSEFGAKFYHLFIDKASQKMRLVESAELLIMPIGFTEDGNFQMCVLPSGLIQFNKRNPNFFSNIEGIISNIHIEDNPIIIEAKINLK